MITTATTVAPAQDTPGRRALRRLVRRRGAMAGLVVILLFIAMAILAPLVAPYDPLQTRPRAATAGAKLGQHAEHGEELHR